MAKQKFPVVVSPTGVAAFSYLSKPDTEGKYADNKFKVTLVLDGDANVDAIKKACLEAARIEWGPKINMKQVRMPITDGDTKGKEEFEGKLLLVAKSKYQPTLVDRKREALAEGVNIFTGDMIKISGCCIPYTASGQKGVTVQLRAVMLVEKRATAGNAAGDFAGFEEDTDDEVVSSDTDDDDIDF